MRALVKQQQVGYCFSILAAAGTCCADVYSLFTRGFPASTIGHKGLRRSEDLDSPVPHRDLNASSVSGEANLAAPKCYWMQRRACQRSLNSKEKKTARHDPLTILKQLQRDLLAALIVSSQRSWGLKEEKGVTGQKMMHDCMPEH